MGAPTPLHEKCLQLAWVLKDCGGISPCVFTQRGDAPKSNRQLPTDFPASPSMINGWAVNGSRVASPGPCIPSATYFSR